VRGATAIVVSANSKNDCFLAISKYLQALK
jgi:hypothetical protein